MGTSKALRRSRASNGLRGASAASRIVAVHTFDDRISLIQQQTWKTLTDRGIRQVATTVVTRRCRAPNSATGDGGWCIAERDRWKEAAALFAYVRANVRYTSDAYGLDTYQTGRRTLELKAGDCDDFTILLCGLAMSIGHSVRFKSIELKNQTDPGYSHIYAQVLANGHWYALDPTLSPLPGVEVSRSRIARHRIDAPIPPGRL